MDKKYDALIEKFPRMFGADGKNTRFSMIIDCGPGWYSIISLLCENIDYHVAHAREMRVWHLLKNRALIRAHRANDPNILRRFFRKRYLDFDESWISDQVEKEFGNAPAPLPPACKKVVIQQAKEKFGTLRFYVRGGDDTVHGMIQMAESMSSVICEQCGRPGYADGQWIKTKCAICHNLLFPEPQ
jgi:hypothetical protein